jgi:NTE family protein
VESAATTGVFLSGLPLFRHAPPESLDRIAAATVRVELAARDYLYHAGEPATQLHVLLSGRIEVMSVSGSVLRELGPGSVLGELSVLTGSVRSASVRARRDSELLAIDAHHFQALVRHDPALGFALLRELSHLLQESVGVGVEKASPAVFTVAPFAGEAFWSALRDAFAELGPTATLDRPDPDGRPFGETLARLEADHGRVLLLADGPDEWRSFAFRQADRVIVLAGSAAPPRAAPLAGAELVLCEALPAEGIGRWLDDVEPRASHVIDPAQRRDGMRRAVRRITGRSLGVVLSGGGARGAAHIGVLEVLAESGFELDRVGGCSIGSFIGVMAASGWEPRRMRDVWYEELVKRSPFADYTVPRVSLIRGRRAESMLRRVFGEVSLEELPRRCFTVSADLISSELVVHQRGPAWDAVGTSMAIPGLAPPQRRGSRLLVDGGVLDNLPVDVMAETGEGPVVASDVVRQPGLNDRAGAEPALPTIMETLARATVLGSAERSAANRGLAALTIVPDVQDIALRDFAQLDRAIEAGRAAALTALESGGRDMLRQALGSTD